MNRWRARPASVFDGLAAILLTCVAVPVGYGGGIAVWSIAAGFRPMIPFALVYVIVITVVQLIAVVVGFRGLGTPGFAGKAFAAVAFLVSAAGVGLAGYSWILLST